MKIKLGKDLIECLSWSLYENPIVLFREALQNSIDAFSLHSNKWEDLSISIILDPIKRSISIKDNGPGLASKKFFESMGAIGDSPKKNKSFAGCRGIGRLSGLGICDEILFSSLTKESNIENSCAIDAKGLKTGLQDTDSNIELAQFVEKYVKFSDTQVPSDSESYFCVTYKNIKRLPSDLLLNPKLVREYIENIAPVTIKKNHIIVDKINSFYCNKNLPNGISIKINNSSSIEKGFFNEQFLGKNSSLEYEETEIKDENGIVIGGAWFIHHDYLGALEKSPFRGLRFRHKGILIGNEDTFSCLFKEARFNRWTIGEVHPFDPKIKPSVKRDDFEPNESFNYLSCKIRPLLFKIGQLARKSSAKRVEEKSLAKIKQQKPFLKKIYKQLNTKLPRSISRQKAIQIAEDIFMISKGKLTVESICSAFLSNKISI